MFNHSILQHLEKAIFCWTLIVFHASWPGWSQLLSEGHAPKIQREEIQCFELRHGVPVGRGTRRARLNVSTPVVNSDRPLTQRRGPAGCVPALLWR